MYSLLERITAPAEFKKLAASDLPRLCGEIRCFLIETISKTGGHIGANLGVIELTTAIHHVFDVRTDKIIFDTGHQGYTHKLLTGRMAQFSTLNQPGGMLRFLAKQESAFDAIEASHAGTAISIGTGFALKNKLGGNSEYIITVTGDGSLVEGMSAEGLNFAVAQKLPMIIVINDNGMAIPPNVGGIKNLFSGDDWESKSRHYFTGLGFQYISVDDGHDLNKLIGAFLGAKAIYQNGATVVHVKTEKGHGLGLAKNHKYKLHFSMPFDPITGQGSSPMPAGQSFAKVAAKKLHELMRADDKIIAITPSTPYASDLDECMKDFPDRVIDVGMAEQQAMGLAVGLALSGHKPVVCYQATFMQRAFDQILHDACYMNLPITILGVRSGFAGFDGATHHGIYDISYLKSLPNLKLFYPGHSTDLQEMLAERARQSVGPMIILYPYENVPENEDRYKEENFDVNQPQIVAYGLDGYILTVGNRLTTALELKNKLKAENLDFGIVNIRWLAPLPEAWLLKVLKSVPRVITLEENILTGGFGSSISALICRESIACQLFCSGIEKPFVQPGGKSELSVDAGIDAHSILNKMKTVWPKIF